jgi:teichuronic acid exporter
LSNLTLSSKILRGTFWSGLQSFINGSFSFLINLLLAKILYPEQFGLVGMAAVFVSFVQAFNELGIGAALVQKKDSELREEHFHTAFWTGIGWGILIYLAIFFLASPLAAKFYNEPVLEEIIPFMGLGILISPINLIHNAQLTKKLDFKKLAFVSNISNVSSGLLASTLAYLGFGVWALVFNSVATYVIATPLFFLATKWIPKLIWEKAAFKDIFGFGIYFTGTNIINNFVSKIDYLLIGKLLSASSLGIYTFAFLLTDTLRSQIMAIMNKVMYPIYGKLQDDIPQVKKYYLNVIKYNSIIVYPIMGFFLLFGDQFIELFFGQKWIESSLPLKILSASVLFHMMVNSNTALIRGLGKPALELKIQLFKSFFLYLPSIFLGTYYYGILGASLAILLNKILSVFIAQFFLKKLINISIYDLWESIKTPLMTLIFSCSTILIFQNLLDIHFLIMTSLFFLLFFALVFFLNKSELLVLFEILKKSREKK